MLCVCVYVCVHRRSVGSVTDVSSRDGNGRRSMLMSTTTVQHCVYSVSDNNNSSSPISLCPSMRSFPIYPIRMQVSAIEPSLS